jgi:hypothetical protein
MLRELVLEIGAEGGSITLVRERHAEEKWLFRVETDETTMIDVLDGELSEEALKHIEFTSQTGYVQSFEEALSLLDKYP